MVFEAKLSTTVEVAGTNLHLDGATRKLWQVTLAPEELIDQSKMHLKGKTNWKFITCEGAFSAEDAQVLPLCPFS